jgi:hypothetical protein
MEFIIDWRARDGRPGALAKLVPLPMSRRDIVDYLALTIETVSRVLGKLEQENVLRVVPEGLQLMGPTEGPLLFARSYIISRVRKSCGNLTWKATLAAVFTRRACRRKVDHFKTIWVRAGRAWLPTSEGSQPRSGAQFRPR